MSSLKQKEYPGNRKTCCSSLGLCLAIALLPLPSPLVQASLGARDFLHRQFPFGREVCQPSSSCPNTGQGEVASGDPALTEACPGAAQAPKYTLCGSCIILSSPQPSELSMLTSHLCSGVLGDQVLTAKFSLSTMTSFFFFSNLTSPSLDIYS